MGLYAAVYMYMCMWGKQNIINLTHGEKYRLNMCTAFLMEAEFELLGWILGPGGYKGI